MSLLIVKSLIIILNHYLQIPCIASNPIAHHEKIEAKHNPCFEFTIIIYKQSLDVLILLL